MASASWFPRQRARVNVMANVLALESRRHWLRTCFIVLRVELRGILYVKREMMSIFVDLTVTTLS